MTRSIAVVGASADRRKFGNKCVRAYAEAGWTVYPVHPTESAVEGLTAYTSVAAIPAERLDRVSVYLAPPRLLAALADIATKPVGELWLNPGTESPEVLAEAVRLGLHAVEACSIVDIGVSPSRYPDA